MNDLSRVRVAGPLAPYRDGLCARLRERGYSVGSARNLLLVAAHFSRWMEGRGLQPEELDEAQLRDYLRQRRESGYVCWRSRRGLEPILEHLRRVGTVPPARAVSLESSPLTGLLARYTRHLEAERGLSTHRISDCEREARFFLQARVGTETRDLGRLSAADVVGHAQAEIRSCSPGTSRNKLSALRSFLRFLYLSGDLPGDLTGAVPSVAGSPRAGLPRGVSLDAVRALVRSFDRRTHVGRRNYAIVLLLSRLGLRGGEVAALELDDIDWIRGQCVIRGKGGREDCLPVPNDVGYAIASYLRRGRPKTASRRVFLQARAPYRELTRGAIAQVVYQASDRTGLPRISPHRLRHTAATEMLRRGASMPEIAQVLRHRHLASTAIYAKVDESTLRPLGRPWPEVE